MNQQPTFIPGRELSQRFYHEVVAPLLAEHFPGLAYAAALIGTGSEVLGFDTAMSMDHDWGPTVSLILSEADEHRIPAVQAMLSGHLPRTFVRFPVGMMESTFEAGTTTLATEDAPVVVHRVFVVTLCQLCLGTLGHDLAQSLTVADWLTFSSQQLLSITSGVVHRDDSGELTALRQRLAWYPHDLWLYLLASGWQRIAQEEHLMPRAGYVGDELGSALIASRLVRDIMYLCFLYERCYAPYPKWFGTAFGQLASASYLTPVLRRVQLAEHWSERERALCVAYEYLAGLHNASGVTEPLLTQVSSFFNRPFSVIGAGRFVDALVLSITDPQVKGLTHKRLIGNIDQWSDSTDIRAGDWRAVLCELYE